MELKVLHDYVTLQIGRTGEMAATVLYLINKRIEISGN
jgi:hypothetical protein